MCGAEGCGSLWSLDDEICRDATNRAIVVFKLQLIRRDKHLVRSTQHLRAEQGIMGNTRIGQRSLLLSDTTTLPSSSSSAHLCPPVSTDLCSNFAVQARTPAPHDGTIEAARIRIQSQDLRAHLVILNRQRLQALW